MRNLKYHCHIADDGHYFIEHGCETCKQKFEQTKSVCSFCCEPVSNKDYLSSDYHQAGKCRRKMRIYPTAAEMERTVDKPMSYPRWTGFDVTPSVMEELAELQKENDEPWELTWKNVSDLWKLGGKKKKTKKTRKAA
jgi:hypothetical protein